MRRVSKLARPLGILMAAIGISMVALSGYYLYAYMRSGSDAESFNVDAAEPEQMLAFLGQSLPEPKVREPVRLSSTPNLVLQDKAVPDDGIVDAQIGALIETESVPSNETVSISSVLPGVAVIEDDDLQTAAVAKQSVGVESEIIREEPAAATAPDDVITSAAMDESIAPPSASAEVMLATFSAIYPGGNMNPRYWSDPQWAGNLPFGGPTIPDGFEPVDPSDLVLAADSSERALRMRIPSIGLDATVSELELRDLGDSRAWSTPDKVVGHIPTTARPGELANGWYFGHLDDFLSNEGAIFRRLPEISEMIRNEPVDIFLATDEAEYIYRVTGTKQVHRDDLFLAESDNAQISLVTCWPFRVYDQRIVVSAVLIAMKPVVGA